MVKDFSIPIGVGGWDTDFASIRSTIDGAVQRLCDPMPADIQARLAYVVASLQEAERQFSELVKALERHGVAFSDDA